MALFGRKQRTLPPGVDAGPLWSLLAETVPDASVYQPGISEWQLADALEDHGAMNEALRTMAHAFPNRDAVWWACQCWQMVPPPAQGSSDAAAQRAAEEWVQFPDDGAREGAAGAAAATGFDTPWALAAAAAGEASADDRAPAEDLTAEYAWGSVMRTLLLLGQPKRFAKHARAALDVGWDIVEGSRPLPG